MIRNTATIHSRIKIIMRNPTGFPNMIPLISFIVPSKKMKPVKYNVVLEMASLQEFKIKTEA